jgi:hypothetical protein
MLWDERLIRWARSHVEISWARAFTDTTDPSEFLVSTIVVSNASLKSQVLTIHLTTSRDHEDTLSTITLSKDAICKAAAPYVFSYRDRYSRATLLERLATTPADVQARVVMAQEEASAAQLKRKQGSQDQRNKRYQAKRRRTQASSEPVQTMIDQTMIHNSESSSDVLTNRDIDHFLDLPTNDKLMDCYRSFLDATSNEALRQDVCASCARRLMRTQLSHVDYLTIKNNHLLKPTHSHPGHRLINGMLLVTEHLEVLDSKALGWICRQCSSALSRNHMPSLTLANNMWIGPIPSALSMLTIPEQLLIALRYPRGYVFKLYPKSGADHPSSLQAALKGNVTTYFANVDAVVKMLQGQLMPRTTSILASLVAVTFISRSPLSIAKLKTLLRVRRKVVHAALLELKYTTCHPGYAELDIDEQVMANLPDDDIPQEILATIRREDDEGIVTRESAGYVPHETTEGQPAQCGLRVNAYHKMSTEGVSQDVDDSDDEGINNIENQWNDEITTSSDVSPETVEDSPGGTKLYSSVILLKRLDNCCRDHSVRVFGDRSCRRSTHYLKRTHGKRDQEPEKRYWPADLT